MEYEGNRCVLCLAPVSDQAAPMAAVNDDHSCCNVLSQQMRNDGFCLHVDWMEVFVVTAWIGRGVPAH